MLRRTGFFREFYPDRPDLPSMREHMRAKRARSEAEIVAYLRADAGAHRAAGRRPGRRRSSLEGSEVTFVYRLLKGPWGIGIALTAEARPHVAGSPGARFGLRPRDPLVTFDRAANRYIVDL